MVKNSALNSHYEVAAWCSIRDSPLACWLGYGALAGGAATGGASEAMIGGCYGPPFNGIRVEVPEHEWLSVAPLHVELLVEIAIINLAPPSDAERVATHEAIDRCGIECVAEQVHVIIEFTAVFQPTLEPRNGHVCDREEMVELDSEMGAQFAFVIGLQLCLIPGQEVTAWIIDKIEAKIPGLRIAEGVEFLKRLNTRIKHPITPLGIDVFGAIAGH